MKQFYTIYIFKPMTMWLAFSQLVCITGADIKSTKTNSTQACLLHTIQHCSPKKPHNDPEPNKTPKMLGRALVKSRFFERWQLLLSKSFSLFNGECEFLSQLLRAAVRR